MLVGLWPYRCSRERHKHTSHVPFALSGLFTAEGRYNLYTADGKYIFKERESFDGRNILKVSVMQEHGSLWGMPEWGRRQAIAFKHRSVFLPAFRERMYVRDREV